ncbi:MAG: hypothetical protein ACLFTI_05590 [Anaerolineales bacterium]
MNQSKWRDKHYILTLASVLGCVLIGLGLLAVMNHAVQAQGGTVFLPSSYKTVFPDQVSPGGTVDYTIVLVNSNTTSSTGEIIVTDPLTTPLTYVSGSAEIAPEGTPGYLESIPQGVRFKILDIDPSSRVTLTFQAVLTTGVSQGDVITNTAVVSDATGEFELSAAFTVAAPPISKFDHPWNDQYITDRGTLEVEGRAWLSDQTPEFPPAPTLYDIPYGSGRDWYNVSWSSVPDVLSYQLQEAKTPDFESPTTFSEGADTTSHYFENKSSGTYYYRLRARNDYGDSFWSNVVSVTVTTSRAMAWGADQPRVAAAPAAATQAPVVEVNIKPVGGEDDWVAVDDVAAAPLDGSWWNWSYDWDLPVVDDATEYVIQTRARDAAGTEFGALDTVTVTVDNGIRFVYLPLIAKRYPPIPFATTLKVDNNDTYGNYALSWSYDHSDPYPPTSYHFQEATDANFTNLTIDENRTSPQSFTDKPVGTYYYRVRARNQYGSGAWSNVVKIDVQSHGYFDDFSDNNSGWPRHTYKDNDRAVMGTWYEFDSYRMKILLDKEGLNNYRMGLVSAPYTPEDDEYVVEVDHTFRRAGDQEVDPTAGKAGLVFRAVKSDHGYFSDVYVVEWNFEGHCAVFRYSGMNSHIPVVTPDKLNWTQLREWVACDGVPGGYDKNVHAKVEVEGNRATVYLNDHHVWSGDIGASRHVGLMTGAWERTPVESRFDNFKVTE